MDVDLLDEWTTMEPRRCGACNALAVAAEHNKNVTHPGALRYLVGLREGWQARRSAARAERAAASHPGH